MENTVNNSKSILFKLGGTNVFYKAKTSVMDDGGS